MQQPGEPQTTKKACSTATETESAASLACAVVTTLLSKLAEIVDSGKKMYFPVALFDWLLSAFSQDCDLGILYYVGCTLQPHAEEASKEC